MAIDTAVQVQGLTETGAEFKRINDREVTRALTKANKSAAQLVVDAALPNVPFRTGRLIATVKAIGTQTSGTPQAGGAKAPHAVAIHFGVGPRPGLRGPHNIQKRPFLFEAAAQRQADVVQEYETEIGRIFDTLRGDA